MAKFRKKPVVVEAMQWTGTPQCLDDIFDWFTVNGESVNCYFNDLKIPTRAGVMTAWLGDWIIRGTNGEFYPCKPEVFADVYEDADVIEQSPGAQYKADCLRTEYTPAFVASGDPTAGRRDFMVARLLHAVLGLMSEVGEIADALKKHIIYGKELDLTNLVEEIGDESWYSSLLLDAIGSSWEEAWSKNIAKLRARYPEKFTQEQALHRDLAAERAVLEGRCPPHPPEHMDMDYKGEPGKHFRCGLCGATFAGMGG